MKFFSIAGRWRKHVSFALMLSCCFAASATAQTTVLTASGVSGETGTWIQSLAMSDHFLYVAGYFDHAGPPSGTWTSFDLASGTPMPSGARIAGTVLASVPDGAGGWFLGGAITGADGSARSGLAHVLADGSASPWAPAVHGQVGALLLHGDTLLVGGAFDSINGSPHANLAAVSATTGALLPWGSGANGRVEDMLQVADTLFVGGAFRFIHGVERSSLAALDVGTGAVLDWSLTFTGSPFASGTPFVTHMALDGSRLYVGGDFNTINGLATGSFAAIERATAAVVPGSFPVGWGTTGILVHGGRIYVSGPFGHYTGAGEAHGLVALSRSTLQLLPWAAEQPRYHRSGAALAASGNQLFVSEGWLEPYSPIDALCAVDTLTGALLPFADSLRSASGLACMQIAGGRLWVGGALQGVQWVPRAGVAEIGLGSGQLTTRELELPQGSLATHVAVAGRHVVVATSDPLLCGFDLEVSRDPAWVISVPYVQHMLGVQGRLFVLGTFPVAGGPATRHGLAEIDPSTGDLLPWSPVFADMGGPVTPVALAADSERLYVGGGFLTVDGAAREGLVAFRLSNLVMETTTFPAMANVLALASTGDRLFVLGDRVGWPQPSLFCMGPSDGVLLPWSPLAGTSGDMVAYPENAIVVSNGELLVANELTVDSGPFAGQHPLFRASLSASNWSPYPEMPVGPVSALAAHEGSLAVVGAFSAFGSNAASGLAIVNWPSVSVPPGSAFSGLDLAVWPAPARDRLTLRCAATSDQRVTIRILDLAGRLEHSIELPAGSSETAWDLRRANGSRIAPGVHFALAMQSGRRVASKRFVVVR